MTSIDRWQSFFGRAGFPKDVANTYAHSFHENRIQLSMLQDLNKEYLRDLGVYRTGDIILILKEAKKMFENGDRDGSSSSSSGKRTEDRARSRSPAAERNPKRKSQNAEPRMLKNFKREVTPPPLPPPPPKISMSLVSETLSKNGKSHASIFGRLGSRSTEELVTKTKTLTVSKGSATSPPQRVLFVKKVPAKATMPHTDSESDDDDIEAEMASMNKEKSVSFSKQDEVMEFSERKNLPPKLTSPRKDIRSRLGNSKVTSTTPTRIVTNTQFKPARKNPPAVVSLRSDKILNERRTSIHDRITLGSKGSSRQSPSFRKKPAERSSNGNGSHRTVVSHKKSGSVFDRLGRNRQ